MHGGFVDLQKMSRKGKHSPIPIANSSAVVDHHPATAIGQHYPIRTHVFPTVDQQHVAAGKIFRGRAMMVD